MTTIASGERPSTANEMFWSRFRPSPGIVASKTSLRCVGRAQRCFGAQKPKNCIFSVSQRTAPADPAVPGARSGYRRESSCASESRRASVERGRGSAGAGRAGGRSTLKATTRSGKPTSSHVPRYMRLLTGRSGEPRRRRRRRLAGAGVEIAELVYAAARRYPRIGRMSDPATILLVDDEESVQKLLTYPLERDGYRVVQARDGDEALSRFDSEPVDLVVLDVMLPRLDGLEVCKRLRARSSVPIVMLTARDDELDKVLGLELGADDYITKPFSIREFRSRVQALSAARGGPAARSGGGASDRDRRACGSTRRAGRSSVDGVPVQVTYVEFELLRTLAGRPGRVFSRQTLLEAIRGGSDYREPRTIDVHVRHLREKLEQRLAQAAVHPDRARRRVPLPRAMKRLVSGVGARLALALLVVLAGALALVYLIVVPSLESRLTHSRLSAARAWPRRESSRELPSDRFNWPDFLEAASASANARVVVYDTVGPPTALVVAGDSQGFKSSDVQRDPIALQAAERRERADGTTDRGGRRFAEAAIPVPGVELGDARLCALARVAADGRSRSRPAAGGGCVCARRGACRRVSSALCCSRAACGGSRPRPSGSRPGSSTSRWSITARTRSASSHAPSTGCACGWRSSTMRGVSSSRTPRTSSARRSSRSAASSSCCATRSSTSRRAASSSRR